MKLDPTPSDRKFSIEDLLADAGIKEVQPKVDPNLSRKERFATALDRNGASLDRIADALGEALTDEKSRVPAARLALEAQGIINDKNGSSGPGNITIVINDPGHKSNILDLVMPNV